MEPQDQQFGSIFDEPERRTRSSEGVGLKLPLRDPDHEDSQWYELDLDADIDAESYEPFPTERHKTLP